MPVSSPSYFPPNRSTGTIVGLTAGTNTTGSRDFLAMKAAGLGLTANDCILIGEFAGGGAGTGAVNTTPPTIAIGNQALQNLTGPDSSSNAGNVAIGYRAAQAATVSSSNVFIGAQAAENTNWDDSQGHNGGASVIIGALAAQNVGSAPDFSGRLQDSIVIGARAAQWNNNNGFNSGSLARSVLIGVDCASNNASTIHYPNIDSCVVIGHSAAIALGSQTPLATGCVIVGDSAAQGLTKGTSAVIVGANIVTDIQCDHGIVIGAGATCAGQTNCIVIGASANITASGAQGSIAIGASAGSEYGNAFPSLTCVIEYLGVGGGALIAGYFGTGNIVLGNSTAGGTRDVITPPWAGTNNLKLLNGVVAVTNPVGGGYFYVSAGALHWVGSSGTDTVIAPA